MTEHTNYANGAHAVGDATAVSTNRGLLGENDGTARDWTNKPSQRDLGLLIWRLLALFLVLHGIHKILIFPTFSAGLAKFPVGSAAPAFFAILVILGQTFLPLFIASGFMTRLAAGLGAFMMLAIWFLVHFLATKDGGFISAQTGGVNGESAWMWVLFLLPLVWLGAGRLSVDNMLGRRRGTVATTRV